MLPKFLLDPEPSETASFMCMHSHGVGRGGGAEGTNCCVLSTQCSGSIRCHSYYEHIVLSVVANLQEVPSCPHLLVLSLPTLFQGWSL